MEGLIESTDLKKVERQAFGSYLQDGAWDIFIGFLLLAFGLRNLTDNAYFTLLIFVGIAIFILERKYITVPRLGTARFGRQRERNHTLLVLGVAISVVATVGVWIASTLFLDNVTSLMDLVMVGLTVLVFAMISYFMGSYRLFVYGVMIAMLLYLGGVVDDQLGGIISLFAGGVVLVLGFSLMIRFVRRYPRFKEDTLDVWRE
ncbi:MAG: hypothetical protein GKC02_10565 [Methanomassiliicoccales archaeon]|nr:hypothetical protein [Methanomassiliicoccales archaeon]